MTQAVIFDFDGVLVDSEPLHEHAIRLAVRPRGWDFTTDRFVSEIVGGGDENAFRKIAAWHGELITDAELRAFLEHKWGGMAEGIAEGRFTVQPGAAEAVRAAAARFPVAVCSGSVRATVLPMLERIGLAGLVRTVVCGDDVARTKPDPEGYLLAAARLNADPTRCVAVEDTPTGVAAAKAAGMRVVAVCHTFPADRLAAADRVFDDIRALDVQ